MKPLRLYLARFIDRRDGTTRTVVLHAADVADAEPGIGEGWKVKTRLAMKPLEGEEASLYDDLQVGVMLDIESRG